MTGETVAKGNDLAFTWGERVDNELHSFGGGKLALDIERKTFVAAYDIDVGQWIAVAVNVDGVIERDLTGKLLLGTEMH